jgi:CheY-like chemotaxis protein
LLLPATSPGKAYLLGIQRRTGFPIAPGEAYRARTPWDGTSEPEGARMRALIAEDNSTTRLLLESTLTDWGYQVITTSNGVEAWQELQQERTPELILLDWKMPCMDGIEVCRKLRQLPHARAAHVILVTARRDKDDIVAGLEAGADDYITKPFEPAELRARLQAGARIVELQKNLADRVRELESALAKVKQLHGLLPICAYCKKIRDDHNYWQQVEAYISSHSEAQFTHGICPDCHERVVKPELEALWGELDTP